MQIAWLKLLLAAVFYIIAEDNGEFYCHKTFNSFSSDITAAN